MELPTTATRPPAGQRLVGQQLGGVEHLRDVLHPDHARVLEQRLHAGARRPARPVAATAAGVLGVVGPAAALHRDDRLGAGEPAREAGELARVAERLQVQQHDVRGRVGLPVLQHVVARQVRAVARGDERRQAQPALGGRGEERDAERAGLAEEADPAGRRQSSGRAWRSAGPAASVFATPSAFGPTTRIPCARASATSRRWALTPSGPASANPALTHDERLDALGQAGVHDVVDPGRGHRDHGEVDVVRDVGDRRVGAHAAHRAGLRR